MVACPVGSSAWEFHFINDSASPVDSAELLEVVHEWGGVWDRTAVDARVADVAPGEHRLLWRGQDDEMRMSLTVRLRSRHGDDTRVAFEFPLLYRRRGKLPRIPLLGKEGWEVAATPANGTDRSPKD
jgi:hypothetical protein